MIPRILKKYFNPNGSLNHCKFNKQFHFITNMELIFLFNKRILNHFIIRGYFIISKNLCPLPRSAFFIFQMFLQTLIFLPGHSIPRVQNFNYLGTIIIDSMLRENLARRYFIKSPDNHCRFACPLCNYSAG